MKLRRWMSALLAAVLLMTMAAVAESEDGFGFDFDDEGYTGEWLELPALGIEFCLPDGWTETQVGEDDGFAAAADDGSAAMEIRVEAEQVKDVVAWADANLSGYEVDTTGFFDTLVTETDDEVAIYRLNDMEQVLAFAFTRASADALSRDFALEIVDSVNEAWIEEGDFFGDETDDDNPFED